jgi:hypothetical protein
MITEFIKTKMADEMMMIYDERKTNKILIPVDEAIERKK